MSLSKEDMYTLVNQKLSNSVSPLFRNETIGNIIEKQEKFAKKVVENLYENIVYKEDFEIEYKDKASTRFANKFVTESIANSICKSTLGKIPTNMSDELMTENAKSIADRLTKSWLEDSKYQLIEIENFKETMESRNIPLNESIMNEKFGLLKEFNRIHNIQKSEEGDLASALISEMEDKDKMILSMRINAFKGSLDALGFDLNNDKLSTSIYDEFGKNLFV